MRNHILYIILIFLYIFTLSAKNQVEQHLITSFSKSGYGIEVENPEDGEVLNTTVCLPVGGDFELSWQGSGEVTCSSLFTLRDIQIGVLSIEAVDSMHIDLSFEESFSLPDQMAESYYRMYEALCPELTNLTEWRDIELIQPSILFIYPEGGGATFEQAYDYLKEWKAQKGFIVSELEVDQNASTIDIKEEIQNAYDNWDIPPEYVCLVGDAGGDYDIPTFSYSEGAGDHYYTLLSGEDGLGDVHIGRLSFNTVSEWQVIVYKTVNYEREPYMGNTDWFSQALLTGDPTNSGTSCVYTNQNIKEVIENNHPEFDYIELYEAPFVDGMLSGINQGVSYFNYRGYWGMSNWQAGTANYTQNGMMLPFAVISTCATGDFIGAGFCRSEAFIRAGTLSNPRGGIGAIGTATSVTHTCFNNCFSMGVSYGLYAENLGTMGAVHTRGKTALWLNYPQNPEDASMRFSYWNNLIGDPSCYIWTGVPKELDIICAETFSHTQENLIMQACDSFGYGIEGLYCCLYNTETEEQHFKFSDPEGYCMFNIADLQNDDYTLTVSGKNYYPYQQEVEILASSDLIISDIQLSDENGSNSLEPGESGTLSLTITNMSNSTITNAALGMNSLVEPLMLEYESVIDALPAGEDLSIIDIACEFTGTSNFSSELLAEIEISWQDGESIDHFSIPVTDLQIDLSDFNFTDDNNNQPEPGETVYLDYVLHNSGAGDLDELYLNIFSNSNLIELSENEVVIGELVSGEEYNSVIPLEIEFRPEFIGGATSELSFHLYNNTGYTEILKLEFNTGEVSSSEPTGPDAYGYCIYDQYDTQYLEVDYDWIEINDSNELQLIDNGDMGDVTQIDLPFLLSFYNQEYTELSICTNGWVSPGFTESASFMNWTIPGEGGISPMIAVFWDDLKMEDQSGIYWYYDESEHYLVIEWDSMLNDWDESPETFELIIYDLEYYPTSNGNNKLKLQYKMYNNVNVGTYVGHAQGNHGQYSTIGIEDQNGVNGLQYTFNDVYPASGGELADERALVISGKPFPSDIAWIILRNSTCYGSSGNEQLIPGDEINLEVNLQNIGNATSEELTLSLSTNDHQNITITSQEIVIDGIGTGMISETITGLSFHIDEHCPPQQELHIELTISDEDHMWVYPITKHVSAPLIQIGEEVIEFEDVMSGYPSNYELRITNSGTANLAVNDITGSSEELNIDFEALSLDPDESVLVNIEYLSEETGTFNESISIYSNDFFDNLKVIPITGTVILPPQIVVDSTLQQITVEEGSISEQSIPIQNQGAGTLTLNGHLEGFYNSWQGAKFDNGYLSLSEPVITGSEFSIEAWVRVDGPGFHSRTDNPIFVQRESAAIAGSCTIAFFAGHNNFSTKLNVRSYGSDGTILVTDAPPEGEWHHYAAVVSADIIQIYIDGELRVADNNYETGVYDESIDYINLGAHIYGGSLNSSLNGMLDEVRIWNRALSRDEINENMNKSCSLNSQDLAAYWTFNESSWQDLVNASLSVESSGAVYHSDSEAKLLDWIWLDNGYYEVGAEEEISMGFTIDSNWLLESDLEYDMNLTITTNDPVVPEINIPFIITTAPSDTEENELPVVEMLGQSYPNPFIASDSRNLLQIDYALQDINNEAFLIIYNVKGQKVHEIILEPDVNGKGRVGWDCCVNNEQIASGIYLYTIKQDNEFSGYVGRMVIIK